MTHFVARSALYHRVRAAIMRVTVVRTAVRAAAVPIGAALGCLACGGSGIPPHPMGEIAARSEARVDLVELVVSDPVRAARVQALYVRAADLRLRFDRARARAWSRGASADGTPDFGEAARRMEGEGAALYREYSALMLEVRRNVTQAEFERLDAIR